MSGFRILTAMLLGMALPFLSGPVRGEEDPFGALEYLASDWYISGDLTARYDLYQALGDDSASIFPDEGGQYYFESFVNFRRDISEYESVTGFFGGLFNRSDYRTTEDDVVVERFRTEWEKGDLALPFRATAGDYFGFTSPRTLQRSLKGGQLELQPDFGLGGNALTSVLLFSGLNAPIYRNLEDDQEIFSGGSILVEDPALGSLIVNVVHNYREARDFTPEQEQIVTSAAVEIPFELGGQILTFESELGFFTGEHAFSEGRDSDGTGVFAELRGRSRDLPLDYSLLYERYGEDYRPNGATIVPDRESAELHTGWRFDNGLRLRGRAQRFVDGLESTNPIESYVGGLNLTGPLANGLIPNLSLQSDAFVRSIDDADGLRDEHSGTATVNLILPFSDSLTGRLGGFYNHTDDEVTDDQFDTIEISAGTDHVFEIGDLQATVSPGVVGRQARGGGLNSDEIGPSVAFSLYGGGHDFRADYRMLFQNRHGDALDLFTHDANLAYSYSYGPHRVGVDATLNTRDPDELPSTESYRIGAFYTYSFDHAPRQARAPQPIPQPRETVADVARLDADITALPPGLPLTDALAYLAASGVVGPSQQAGVIVYETPTLEAFSERQRLALVHKGGVLRRVAVIVDFDDVGRPDSLERTFERVREAFIKLYGPPQSSLREGDFTADLADDLNGGRFIRFDEWTLDQGTLRFGIPRRLDRQVRMELQYARDFPATRTGPWSIEEVR